MKPKFRILGLCCECLYPIENTWNLWHVSGNRESILITIGCGTFYKFVDLTRNIITGFTNTPLMLVHSEKCAPEAIRSGQMPCFFSGILIPYNLPHVLVYSYWMVFLLTSHQAVRALITSLIVSILYTGMATNKRELKE